MYLRCRQPRTPVTDRRCPPFRHHRDLRTAQLLRHRGMGQLRPLPPPGVRARVVRVDQLKVDRVRVARVRVARARVDRLLCALRKTARRRRRLRLRVTV
ncbi:hypothetical protein CH251_20275 [Rhodococcus sp. 06-462-5]|nr:hypothetical protein CH251_20275 [Rhodococcus sp. 06-462-5]OZE66258.1 hypothetical protein CH270_11770 [Rhodococcus sp. 02-925g]